MAGVRPPGIRAHGLPGTVDGFGAHSVSHWIRQGQRFFIKAARSYTHPIRFGFLITEGWEGDAKDELRRRSRARTSISTSEMAFGSFAPSTPTLHKTEENVSLRRWERDWRYYGALERERTRGEKTWKGAHGGAWEQTQGRKIWLRRYNKRSTGLPAKHVL